jgi:hypothetical protein
MITRLESARARERETLLSLALLYSSMVISLHPLPVSFSPPACLFLACPCSTKNGAQPDPAGANEKSTASD